MQEVRGSSPLSSTDHNGPFHRVWRSIECELWRLVAGEGWFGTKRNDRTIPDVSGKLSS